jgi:hypothetical protein
MPTLTPITYAGFSLNDGINYFVTKKSYNFPSLQPATFKIGRLEGMKKTGENINERKINIEMRVLGVSRIDLENKLDALQQALFIRNAALVMHSNDSRYFVCDCTNFTCDLAQGNVISTTAKLEFTAFIPFAYANATSLFDSGVVAYTTISGVILGYTSYTASYTFAGGGNVYSRPNIRIVYNVPPCATTMTGATLTIGQIYTSVATTATPADLYAGDDLILTLTGHVPQSVVVSTFTPAGSTSIPVGGFSALSAYTTATTIVRSAIWQTVQVTQTTDTQTISLTGQLPAVNGDYMDINCDPTQGTGYLAIINSGVGNLPLPTFNGVFPVQEPYATTWTVAIVSNSTPQVEVEFTWVPRWIS